MWLYVATIVVVSNAIVFRKSIYILCSLFKEKCKRYFEKNLKDERGNIIVNYSHNGLIYTIICKRGKIPSDPIYFTNEKGVLLNLNRYMGPYLNFHNNNEITLRDMGCKDRVILNIGIDEYPIDIDTPVMKAINQVLNVESPKKSFLNVMRTKYTE
jgi:hypothetical protein